MIVDEEYRVNIYLDTNILVDYIEETYPLLNESINYLSSCPFVNLRSSHYVLFEYTEVRKYNLFMSKSEEQQPNSLKNKILSFFCKNKKDLDKDALKAKIKRTWKRNGLRYETIKDEIINKIQEELEILRNNLNLDFNEHVLHESLVFPTNSLCLSTKISKEDCLVMVSCMHPQGELKLEQCILLSRDKQYYKAYNDNTADVNSVFKYSNLLLPNFIRTDNLVVNNKCFSLYKNEHFDVKEVWNEIIRQELKSKHKNRYIGETYSSGKNGISTQCIYFNMEDPNHSLEESDGLLFISRDLCNKFSIEGPFEFWNNKKVSLPYKNPTNTKYSFLPTSIDPNTLVELRKKGNLVFYENY